MNDFFNKYPYTDFHELNLDWLINYVKGIESNIQDVKYADNYARKHSIKNYNVLDYVDDITADNSHKIRDLIIYAMENGGGTIYFPAGIYRFNISITSSDTTARGNVNVILKGDGINDTIFKPSDESRPVFEFEGVPGFITTTDFFRVVSFSGFTVQNVTDAYAMKLSYMQYVRMNDVVIRSSKGGLYMMNVYDSLFYGTEVLSCNTDNNAFYSIHLDGQCNAQHFVNCHIEGSTRFMRISRYCYHNVIMNTKFEQGPVIPATANLIIVDSEAQNDFIGCVFVANDNSTGSRVVNNGNAFIYTVPNAKSTKCTSFIGCDFAISDQTNQCCHWLDIAYTKVIGCHFYGVPLYTGLQLKTLTEIADTTFVIGSVDVGGNGRLMKLGGSYAKINCVFDIANVSRNLYVFTAQTDTSCIDNDVKIKFVNKGAITINSIDGITSIADTTRVDIYPKIESDQTTSLTVNGDVSLYRFNNNLTRIYGGYIGQIVYIECTNASGITLTSQNNIFISGTITIAVRDVFAMIKGADGNWRLLITDR